MGGLGYRTREKTMKGRQLKILLLILLTILGHITVAYAGEAQAYATVTIIIPSQEEIQQMKTAQGLTGPAQETGSDIRLAAANVEEESLKN